MTRNYGNRGFALATVVGVSALLLALSGALLLRTTEARLSLRKLAEANTFSMSMDEAMRNFSSKTTAIALTGTDLDAFTSPDNLKNVLAASFPPDWQAGTKNGNVDIFVGVESYPKGSAAIDLMNAPAVYDILTAEKTRSNLLPPGQEFAGRRWGFMTSTHVALKDNLADIKGSWYKRMEESMKKQSKRTIGGTNLIEASASNIVLITEFPSQFSVQGQNMVVEKQHGAGSQANFISAASKAAPTILGKNVKLSTTGVSMDANRRFVARGRAEIEGQSTAYTGSLMNRAEAGASKEQELEEAGSSVLVNVGTRGPEIFRPSSDYRDAIARNNQISQKNVIFYHGDGEYFKYWLPYYQCNIRVVVRMPSSSPASADITAPPEPYSVSASFYPRVDIPSKRDKAGSMPSSLQGLGPFSSVVNRFGKNTLSLDPSASTLPRPVTVISRNYLISSSGSDTWMNTIDLDVGTLLKLANTENLESVAIHVDIRGPNGEFLENAAEFPVVLRQTKIIDRPLSVVTPGTIYIQGPFASEKLGAVNPPYSLLAPRIRYGAVGRSPAEVALKGQRVVVGGAAATSTTPSASSATSTPLAIYGGDEEMPVKTENRLANIRPAKDKDGNALLPPVFLKDWLVVSQNIWIDR